MDHEARELGEMHLLFIGDSITESGRDFNHPERLGTGYVAGVAKILRNRGESVRVTNVGCSGNRAAELEARWEADVTLTAPDILSVYIGINEVMRRHDRNDPTSDEDFEASLHRCLSRRPSWRRLLLVEPFLLVVNDEQRAWLPDLEAKQAVLRRVAHRFGADLVELQDAMTSVADGIGAAAVAHDGVHPTPLGVAVITRRWLETYDRTPN